MSAGARRANDAVAIAARFAIRVAGARRAIGFSNTRTRRSIQLFASPRTSQIATLAFAAVAVLSVATFGTIGTRCTVGFGNA